MEIQSLFSLILFACLFVCLLIFVVVVVVVVVVVGRTFGNLIVLSKFE